MKEKEFNNIIKAINRGNLPPKLGYNITREQYYKIFESCAYNIEEWGYNCFKKYVETWLLGISLKEELRRIKEGKYRCTTN